MFSRKFYVSIIVIIIVFFSVNESLKNYAYFYYSYLMKKEIHAYKILRTNFSHLKDISSSCYFNDVEKIREFVINEVNNSSASITNLEIRECINVPGTDKVNGVLVYTRLEDGNKVIFMNYIFFISIKENKKGELIMWASKNAS